MKIQDIIAKVETRKGANLSATIHKTLKTLKGVEDVIEKKTRLVVRGGIDYDNIALVQEMRESGQLPDKNAGLPWGEWAQFPYHITHKEQDYARFYPASGIDFSTHVEYYRNGNVATKEEVKDLCLKSEFSDKEEKPLCYTIKAENVQTIG
jgi:hypothetical protein